ncbi:MAG: phenylalanine--tRNA ligase subunit beta, partial [Patescibacteria group bacterium]
INNVVDSMNYVMLETGQPLHAFDYDKLAKNGKANLIIRRAERNESLVSIDGVKYALTSEMLVIADKDKPLIIAGIKGGTGCEVTEKTKRIIVEAANFDFVSILKTSKKLGLSTDASQRFSHNLSPALVEIGLNRAEDALLKLANAKAGERFDSLAKPLPKKLIKFDVLACNKLIGITLTEKEAGVYLQKLGFKNIKKDLWEVPSTRNDIETQEDMTEEIVRLYGYAKVAPKAPRALLVPPETNDAIVLRESIRNVLVGFGFDEVYNHSFIAKDDIVENKIWREKSISLLNPTSAEFEYLRPSLLPMLLKNADANARYFPRIRLFEIGNVFLNNGSMARESTNLGIVVSEKGSGVFFELKGIVTHLLKSIGLSEFYMKEVMSKDNPFFVGGYLELKADNIHFGYLGVSRDGASVAELDLKALLPLVEGEHEFIPLQKYPTVMRDISMFVSTDIRIGELIQAIQEVNLKLISDVDLVDEYIDEAWANLQSITLRVMFEAKDRTLTSEEVDREMKKITELLQKQFSAKLR